MMLVPFISKDAVLFELGYLETLFYFRILDTIKSTNIKWNFQISIRGFNQKRKKKNTNSDIENSV